MTCLQARRLLESIEADFDTSGRAHSTFVNGRDVGFEPGHRRFSLAQLRDMLLSEAAEPEPPDAIWRHVIKLTRGSDSWELAALWLLLPSLRQVRRRIFTRDHHGRQDIEGERLGSPALAKRNGRE